MPFTLSKALTSSVNFIFFGSPCTINNSLPLSVEIPTNLFLHSLIQWIHSTQGPHRRHLFASRTASSSYNVNSTSSNEPSLFLIGIFFALRRVARSGENVSGANSLWTTSDDFSFSSGSPRMYRSIACAARCPAAIALITVLGPVTASPPAKTPGFDVIRVFSSTSNVSHFVILTPQSLKQEIYGF